MLSRSGLNSGRTNRPALFMACGPVPGLQIDLKKSSIPRQLHAPDERRETRISTQHLQLDIMTYRIHVMVAKRGSMFQTIKRVVDMPR